MCQNTSVHTAVPILHRKEIWVSLKQGGKANVEIIRAEMFLIVTAYSDTKCIL